MKRLPLLILILLVCLPAFAQKTFIHCGRLIDVAAGKVRKEVTIVVDGKKVTAIKNGFVTGAAGDEVIDLGDKTVMPGLIDCHVHLEYYLTKSSNIDGFRMTDADKAYRAAVYAKTTLMAGFTTVRDLGGSGVNISLRNAINSGLVDGPNVLTAGRAISSTGGHMDKSHGYRDDVFDACTPDEGVADGRDEMIKAVRLQHKRGSDLIKIASTGGVLDFGKDGAGAQMSIDEIRAIVETAKDYGMRVACHAHGAEGIRRAVIAGVNSIEHGTFLDDECIRLMKRHGTWLVSTLTAGNGVTDSAMVPGFFPPVIANKAIVIAPRITSSFTRAYKAGVKIAFGTDAGVYEHGKNYLEFKFMTEAGMTPMDAIRAATIDAAELLGIKKERGSIAPGQMADIIAVDGNPLHDISAMGRVIFVMKEGRIYKR